MFKSAYIIGLAHEVPERILTNADLERMVDTTDEWITTRTGIKTRHIIADDESTADLATRAAEKAIAHAGIDPAEIDWVICSTDTPEVGNPATACFVQPRIGAVNASAMDFTGGCSGFLQAIAFAEGRVRLADETVLVIGVEVLSRIIDWTDRATCVLFGDGAGAVVMRGADQPTKGAGGVGARVAGGFSRTDGAQADVLMVPAGGTRYPSGDPRLEQIPKLVMNGQAVFRWAVERMTEAAAETLQRGGLAIDQIDLVIPHQANQRILSAVGQRLGLPAERIFSNVARYGNTGSASIGIALGEALQLGDIKGGERVLCVAFGSGFTWAGLLLEFV